MRADVLPVPGIVLGVYPERRTAARDPVAAMLSKLRSLLPVSAASTRDRFISLVDSARVEIDRLDGDALALRIADLRARLARHGLTDTLVAEAFAAVSTASSRALGLTPFPTQLVA